MGDYRPPDYFGVNVVDTSKYYIEELTAESERRVAARKALQAQGGMHDETYDAGHNPDLECSTPSLTLDLGRSALVDVGDGYIQESETPVEFHVALVGITDYVDGATSRAEARRRVAEIQQILEEIKRQIDDSLSPREHGVHREEHHPPPMPEIIQFIKSEKEDDRWIKAISLDDLVRCTDHLSAEELREYYSSDEFTREAMLLAKYAEGFGLVAVVEASVDRMLYGNEPVDKAYRKYENEYRNRVEEAGHPGRHHSFNHLEYRVNQDLEGELLKQAIVGGRLPGPNLVEMKRLDGYITEDQDGILITFNRLFVDLCDEERARQKQFWNARPQLRRLLEEKSPDLLPAPGHTFDNVLVDRIKSEFAPGKRIEFAIPPDEIWRPWVQGLRDAYFEYIVKTGDRTCIFSLVERDGNGGVLEEMTAPQLSDYASVEI